MFLMNPLDQRLTRSSFCSKKFQVVCFFCWKADQDSNLRQAMTLKLNQRVRQGASLLCDEMLLAKLSERDMVATEAKYHNTCLCSFYKKKVKKNNKESNSASICDDTVVYGVVLSETINYMKKSLQSSNVLKLFQLSQLKKLYWYLNRVAQHTV